MNAQHPAVTLLDRPLAGSDLYGVGAVFERRRAVVEGAVALAGRGGVLFLPFDPPEERSLLLVLGLAAAELSRRLGAVVPIGRPLGDPLPQPQADGVALVHHAPRVNGLEPAVREWVTAGGVVVLTGLAGELERLSLAVPCRWLRRPHVEAPPEKPPTLPQEGGRALRFVAASDLWGVPVPFDLLAEAMGRDDDHLAAEVEGLAQRGLLHWVERTSPPALLVATGGELAAQAFLDALAVTPDQVSAACETLAVAADPAEAADRRWALGLFRVWLAAPARRHRWLGPRGAPASVRDLLGQHGPRLAAGATFAGERLAWGCLLSDWGLHGRAQQVFGQAPATGRLTHARAHALARWALGDPARVDEARAALRQAAAADERNPYAWHAWGVFEQRLGRLSDARNLLDSALRLAPRNGVALAARADLFLDDGAFDQALRLLERAAQEDPSNPFVLHLAGRLRHARGDDEGAADQFRELLAQDPSSVHALHGLGMLAADAGDDAEAQTRFAAILAVDPENAAALHALSAVALRQAEARPGEAAGLLDTAEARLAELLAVEPGNPQAMLGMVRVALARGRSAERPEAHWTAARQRLEAFLGARPDNLPALHLAGTLAEAQGLDDEAEARYLQVLDRQNDNLYALASLAELAGRRGDAAELERRLADLRRTLRARSRRLPAHERARWEERLTRLEAGDKG